jgi:hypothetical protein
MSWLLSAMIAWNSFASGNDVWVTLPSESVVAFYHDQGFNFVGVYSAYICPRSGKLRVETGDGGCDLAIGWDQQTVWLQWSPKVLGMNEDGEFIMTQPDCAIVTLWEF